jgi:hypothetical protein
MTETAFTLPFLGRDEELKALADFYHRGWHRGAGFLLLYGRKGVGKTHLLQQFLDEQAITDAFYWQAPQGNAAAQLRDFSQALWRYEPGHDPLPTADFSFFDWRVALDHLAQIAERSHEPKLFILEGFTELCHQALGVSSYFQHAWDGRLKEIPNLRLILTGSHISTMIGEVLAYSAPLYFRANASLHLHPLRYTALLDLFPTYSPEERLAIYAITGGIPAYLSTFAPPSDVRTGVEALCYAPDSSFLSDMETLFDERLDKPELCQAIVTAVAHGFTAPDRLSHQLGMPYEELQRELYFLRLLRVLADERSVHDPIASLRVRHVMAEPSLSFYYQHLKPALGGQNPRETATAVYASLYEALGREPFITLCREWIWAAAVTHQLGLLPERVGAYWDDRRPSLAFPIAIADTWQKKLLVGEVFWENGRLTPAAVGAIVHTSHQLPQIRKEGWTVAQVIFSRWPVAAESQAAAAAMGVRLVLLAEIEPLLLAARTQLRWERDNPSKVEIEF